MGISAIRILVLVVGFAIYMGFLLLSRFIQNKAFSTLSSEKKSEIFNAFSLFRKYNLVPAALLLVLYIMFIKVFTSIPYLVTNILFGATYICYLIFTLLFIFFKLKKLDVEKSVALKIVFALALQYFGMVITLVALVAYFFIPIKFAPAS